MHYFFQSSSFVIKLDDLFVSFEEKISHRVPIALNYYIKMFSVLLAGANYAICTRILCPCTKANRHKIRNKPSRNTVSLIIGVPMLPSYLDGSTNSLINLKKCISLFHVE